MARLHIHTKLECSTGSSDEEEDGSLFGGGDKEEEEDKDTLQALLVPHMAQTLLTLSKKEVIEVKKKDNSSDSDKLTDMSAFKAWPFNKAKVEKKKFNGKRGKKDRKTSKKEEKVERITEIKWLLHKLLQKNCLLQRQRSLSRQQMKQRGDVKAMRK
eukprot:15366991-Ditylum_brightwellii.AAC.1